MKKMKFVFLNKGLWFKLLIRIFQEICLFFQVDQFSELSIKTFLLFFEMKMLIILSCQ